ncbi:MAG: L,D-transpeptidase [Kofleriaceae bacterium]
MWTRALLLMAIVACAGTDDGLDSPADLPLGELDPADAKADGGWGAALDCKPIPDLPPLGHPAITISIDGLTLRLDDPDTGFQRVYPIGVGTVATDPGSLLFGESRSMYPVVANDRADFTIKRSATTRCKVWWTDPATGRRLPVFAGLPYLPWSGSYAIHGPVDGYRAANGGRLRQGFVSHGCIRMEAADILELYALIQAAPTVPVHVQRDLDRTFDGARYQPETTWLGAECGDASDCGFPGAECRINPWAHRGFCTRACTSTCPDRPGQPASFCVADPTAPGQGMCVPRHGAINQDCRSYDHMVPTRQPRFGQPVVESEVCLPGSPGWIGDHCLAGDDCGAGLTCTAGVCTQTCQRFCPDQPGTSETGCVLDDNLGDGGHCARTCDRDELSSSCPAGMACLPVERAGASGTRDVCTPVPI